MAHFGPTKPLQVASPTAKDIVESESLLTAVAVFTIQDRTRHAIEMVERTAKVIAERCVSKRARQTHQDSLPLTDVNSSPAPATWVKAFAFGSAGLSANVASSDYDVYVGRVPHHPPHIPSRLLSRTTFHR